MFSLIVRTLWIRLIFVLPLFVLGCSGLERSEREKTRKRNAKGERIYRSHKDFFAPLSTPEHTPRAPYPWEVQNFLPRITRDYFRCKGTLDPSDCRGSHGLPILRGKEGVYPVLLDLLNYVQEKTHRKVILTCGHRCPIHNALADPAKENETSKHQIGAEVDFYVQGIEDKPLDVVELLLQYYKETYPNRKELTHFQRYDKPDSHVSTPPWMNKEIYIKLNQPNEGRDLDNQHPYPYLTLQVRFDRDAQEKVTYNWEKANRGYPRR